MQEITTRLSDKALTGLARLAEQTGLSPEEALASLVDQELTAKTRPRPVRGKVHPFRRRD